MNLGIYDTKYWKIKLSPKQYYLGRCIIILKRECPELSKVTNEEFLDLLDVIRHFEKSLKEGFGATMFNWTCIMNNSYKETNDEKPQVHFHARPRYKEKVELAGRVFEDNEFAHFYDRVTEKSDAGDVSEELLQKILEKMKKFLERV